MFRFVSLRFLHLSKFRNNTLLPAFKAIKSAKKQSSNNRGINFKPLLKIFTLIFRKNRK